MAIRLAGLVAFAASACTTGSDANERAIDKAECPDEIFKARGAGTNGETVFDADTWAPPQVTMPMIRNWPVIGGAGYDPTKRNAAYFPDVENPALGIQGCGVFRINAKEAIFWPFETEPANLKNLRMRVALAPAKDYFDEYGDVLQGLEESSGWIAAAEDVREAYTLRIPDDAAADTAVPENFTKQNFYFRFEELRWADVITGGDHRTFDIWVEPNPTYVQRAKEEGRTLPYYRVVAFAPPDGT